MLTEQDIAEAIQFEQYGDINPYKAAQTVHSKHLAECERLMELAFNEARLGDWKTHYGQHDFEPIHKTFQDFKNSLKP